AYRSISRIEKEKDLLQDDNFLSLKEACDKLDKEKRKRGISTEYMRIALTDLNTHYSRLTKYFVEVDTIYGKSPSSAFVEWRIINKTKFNSGEVRMENGGIVLYSA